MILAQLTNAIGTPIGSDPLLSCTGRVECRLQPQWMRQFSCGGKCHLGVGSPYLGYVSLGMRKRLNATWLTLLAPFVQLLKTCPEPASLGHGILSRRSFTVCPGDCVTSSSGYW